MAGEAGTNRVGSPAGVTDSDDRDNFDNSIGDSRNRSLNLTRQGMSDSKLNRKRRQQHKPLVIDISET